VRGLEGWLKCFFFVLLLHDRSVGAHLEQMTDREMDLGAGAGAGVGAGTEWSAVSAGAEQKDEDGRNSSRVADNMAGINEQCLAGAICDNVVCPRESAVGVGRW